MNKEAFERGFIKAAQEYGLHQNQAVYLLKQAGFLSTIAELKAKDLENLLASIHGKKGGHMGGGIGSLVGGTAGAGLGYLSGDEEEGKSTRGRNAAIGALLGGTAGGTLGGGIGAARGVRPHIGPVEMMMY